MKHLVYKTTNLVNGKYYIGVHSCKCNPCRYLGSGVALKKAIRKYGRDSFSRETLKEFETREEAFQYEREKVISNFNCYNLTAGGSGESRQDINLNYPVIIDNVYFHSMAKAAEEYNVSTMKISRWVKRGWGRLGFDKVIYKGTIYPSKYSLSKKLKVHPSTISNWLNSKTNQLQVIYNPKFEARLASQLEQSL